MEPNNNEDNKKEKTDCRTGCLNRLKGFGKFVWNSETREVLGRTGLSWVKILSFYIVFYGILAAFFAICMVVFLKTLDATAPTQQMLYSMLKNNPGVGFVPQSQNDGTDIYFNATDNSTFSGATWNFTGLIADELSKYSTDANSKLKNCSAGNGATMDQACQFSISQLGSECTIQNNFGYSSGRPCVLLKINKVYRWDPSGDTLDSVSCASVTDASNSCKLYNTSIFKRSDIKSGFISVSCEGENDGDKDNLKAVKFYPSTGFPAYYFPYYNQPSYLPPLVMAQFDVIPGRAIMILCQIWTKSIKHDQNDLQGSIHFELLVDIPRASATSPSRSILTSTPSTSTPPTVTTTISSASTT